MKSWIDAANASDTDFPIWNLPYGAFSRDEGEPRCAVAIGDSVSVLPDVSLGTIFRGVIPFWIADVVRLTLLIAFPALSLWLLGFM